MQKHIPNIFTALNIICGFLGVTQAFSSHENGLLIACYLVGIAAIFDFIDGMSARLLGAYSDLGKQFDSLADMVSFGLLPGIIMYKLMLVSSPSGSMLPYAATVIPLFSALRLAKFNLGADQEDSFIGLPTPAHAILLASLPLAGYQHVDISILVNPEVLALLSGITSFLLVSRVPMFSLKMKTALWSENKTQYLFIVTSLIIISVFHFIGFTIVIILYILTSLLKSIIKPS